MLCQDCGKPPPAKRRRRFLCMHFPMYRSAADSARMRKGDFSVLQESFRLDYSDTGFIRHMSPMLLKYIP